MRTTLWILAASLLLPMGIAAADTSVTTINIATNDIVYDPFSLRIYASRPSSAVGGAGNSLTRIHPFTGAVETSTFVGSEPGKLAISDNGQYIYAALDGAAAVRRFNVQTGMAEIQFGLGSSSYGPNLAEDIAVMPGDPGTIAVSRRRPGVSPRHGGVAIFDNGLMRPTTTPDHTGSNRIEFGSDPQRLYGYNNETTEFGFRRMDVHAQGVSTLESTRNLISGFGVDIRWDDGRIYATSGRVIDAENRTLLGTFATSGLVEPDSTVGRTFFLTGSGSTRTLYAFDQETFVPLESLTIPGVSGTPGSLIRWGADGLAFRTDTQLFLIRSSIVPEPATALLLLAAAGFALRRR